MHAIPKENLASLMGIVKRINSTLDLNETLFTIMSEAKNIMRSEASSLMLIDPDTHELYFNTATGEKGNILREIRVPLGKGVAGIVASTGQSLMINDAKNDARIFRAVDEKTGILTRNLIGVPLSLKGRILGVLEVINKIDADEFTAEDLELLETFSEFAALAINNRELYQQMKNRAFEASALYRLSECINYCDSIEELLTRNVRIVSEVLEANRVSIIAREGSEFKFKAAVGLPDHVTAGQRAHVTDHVLEFILKTGQGVFSPNINEDERFTARESLRYKDPSFVSAPLKFRGTIFAFICATERRRKQPYSFSDLTLLEMMAQQISENYKHSMLSLEYKEKQKLDAEISITANIQQDILPKEFPSEGPIDIAAQNVPARLVGGDFYDCLSLGGGRYGILIADVSGKGIPAGLFMAISHRILRLYFTGTKSPAAVFTLSNDSIHDASKRGMFVTVFGCIVDTAKKEITYSSAGHFDQYLVKKKEAAILPLKTPGKPLGMFRGEKFCNRKVRYDNGDLLLLYTDGVTDARNQHLEPYGEDRLKNLLIRLNHEKSKTLLDKILEDVSAFQSNAEPFDDITLMAARL